MKKVAYLIIYVDFELIHMHNAYNNLQCINFILMSTNNRKEETKYAFKNMYLLEIYL